MIELKVKIEEKLKKNYGNIIANTIEVGITEIGRNANSHEEEISEILIKRLKNGKNRIEILNKPDNFEEIADELYDDIFNIEG